MSLLKPLKNALFSPVFSPLVRKKQPIVVEVGPTLLVWDPMDEDVNTPLQDHPPTTDNTGLGWTVDGSNFTVIASTNELNVSSTANHLAYITNTVVPYICRHQFHSTRDRVSICMRAIDQSNQFHINADISGGSMSIFERVGGANATRALQTGLTILTTDNVYGSDDGGVLSGGFNTDAPTVSYSTTALNSSQKVGVNSNGSQPVGTTSVLIYVNTTDPNDLVEP